MLQKVFSVLVLSGVLAAPVLGAQNAPSGQEARAAKPPVMVNLNTASLAELETLPGIGPKVAARIVEYRKMKGPFRKIEESLEIPSSCPYLLKILDFGARHLVSGSR